MVIFIVLSILFILACIIFGDWKNWRKYYPTILFCMFGAVMFDLVVYKNHLWRYYAPGVSDIVFDLFWFITIFPATILIYLYRIPEQFLKRVIYIACWVAAYTSIELVLYFSGHMIYLRSWGIIWSVMVDIVLLISLYLHQKKPFLGWLTSVPFFTAIILIFKINPFE